MTGAGPSAPGWRPPDPVPEQLEKRLSNWHAGSERYPVQLHELERGEYLDMKRREIQRQQVLG